MKSCLTNESRKLCDTWRCALSFYRFWNKYLRIFIVLKDVKLYNVKLSQTISWIVFSEISIVPWLN